MIDFGRGATSSCRKAYRFFMVSPKKACLFFCVALLVLAYPLLEAALLLFYISQMGLFLLPSPFPVPQRPAVPGTFGPLRGSDPTKLYGSPRVPEPHPGDPVQQHQHFAMQVINKQKLPDMLLSAFITTKQGTQCPAGPLCSPWCGDAPVATAVALPLLRSTCWHTSVRPSPPPSHCHPSLSPSPAGRGTERAPWAQAGCP